MYLGRFIYPKQITSKISKAKYLITSPMKKNISYLLLVLLTLTASLTKAQSPAPNLILKEYAVVAKGDFTDNNPNTIYGLVGVYGSISGTFANEDSVITNANTEFADALEELLDFKVYLNAEAGTDINELEENMSAGIYTIPFDYTTNTSQTIHFSGSSTDLLIINITGNLDISDNTNIVLDGILPENVFWNVNGNLTINKGSWVYGTFFASGNITIGNDIEGAFSIFSESNITVGNTTALTSVHYLTVANGDNSQVYCDQSCIESNLVMNGDFSVAPICDGTPSANGFVTDLTYKYSININNPCGYGVSEPDHYKIDDELAFWNKQCNSLIADHTGNGSNLLFVDAFNSFNIDPVTGLQYTDTTNTRIWQQEIASVEPGREYLFSFWAANINRTKIKPTYLRILFNGVEQPNTRQTIFGGDLKWRQHCVSWIVPGNIGAPNINVTITVEQVDHFESGNGQDFVMDDIAFGKRGATPVQVIATVTSNYCTGNNTTLSIVNPQHGYTYQWMLNGNPISGATGSSYVTTVSGTYSVTGTSNLGCSLSSNSVAVTIVILPSEISTYTVTSTPALPWTPANNPFGNISTVNIKNVLRINKDVHLIIKGMRFEFGVNAKVFIEDGATLTLESESGVPTIFTAYTCPNTMWQGIIINATSTSVGKLEIKTGCIIEHARIGASNFNAFYKQKVNHSGYIEATGAIFRNNYVAVELVSKSTSNSPTKPFQNKSYFMNCQFLTTANMKDAISYPDGYHKTFVDMAYIADVRFVGTTFKNTYHILHPASVNNVFDEAKVTKNKGISALFSVFTMRTAIPTNEFINLWVGIDYASAVGVSTGQVIRHVKFKSTAYGIIMRGGVHNEISGCIFSVDPAYSYGSTKVPKYFVGINARGSIGYTIIANEFYDGYCGIISKDGGIKNADGNIYKNTFTNVGRTTKGNGQGIYMLGNNYGNNEYNVQVKCNSFVSTNLVRNHWVSDGMMNTQGACISSDPTSPAGNTFNGVNPANADIYVKNPESGFIYNTHTTAIPSITPFYKEGNSNMTSVYVNGCGYTYSAISACPTDLPLINITEVLADLNTAIESSNDAEISRLLYSALKYYEESDTTGESSISLLNETPHTIAKWLLVGRYIQSDRFEEANNLLEIISVTSEEEEAEKKFYQTLIQLENEGASLLELTESAIEQLTDLAQSEYYVSYQAQGILHYLYGNGYYIPLPYEGDEESRPLLNPDTASISKISDLTIYPNPSTDVLTIGNPDKLTITKVEILNTSGMVILEETYLKSDSISLDSVANGIYIVVLYTENGDRTIRKLIVAK